MNKFDLAIQARQVGYSVTIAYDGAMVIQTACGEFLARVDLPDNKGMVRCVCALDPNLAPGARYESEELAVQAVVGALFSLDDDEMTASVRGGWSMLSVEDQQRASHLLGSRVHLLRRRAHLMTLLGGIGAELNRNRSLLMPFLPLDPA